MPATNHAPQDAQKNSDILKAEVEAVLTGELSSHSHAGGGQAFPVGSVFIAVVSTNPNTLLGYGTWAAFSAGRVLVGLDSGDIDFDVVEEIGGAKTHTHDDHASHTHVAGTLVTDTETGTRKGGTNGAATLTNSHDHAVTGSTGAPSATLTHSSPSHLSPYIVVYMWKRTA